MEAVMIIGLTGKNAAGKGEVAKFLIEGGYQYYSLSDVLREEMKAKGITITRDNLIKFANEMRTAHGGSVLAERVLAKLDPEKNYVVDSIRNPFEVEALRRRKDFALLMVDSDPKIRFERIKARNREGDPQVYKEFLKIEAAEAGSNDPMTQQLNRTQEMADAVVENNGTVDELHEQLRQVCRMLASGAERPDWDTYFMDIAKVAAMRSNCMKRKIAAVIVRDHRIISTGYNGTPRGIKNCNDGGCPRCNHFGKTGQDLGLCLCCHAEENAIVQAAYHGVSIKDATIYCTFSPCLGCAKMIINGGIVEVIYNESYPMEELSRQLLQEAAVKISRHKV